MPHQFTPSTQYNYKEEYLRTVLETMKQKMVTAAAAAAAEKVDTTTTTTTTTTAIPNSEPLSIPTGEFVIGVGYVLLILVFLIKVFFRTLNQFTSDYSSSHDGVYNRFAFIVNADSDSEFSTESDEIDTTSESLSPVQQRSIYTPQHPPQSPRPPLRRSKRLQMKSEMNLTTLEKQTQTQSQIQHYTHQNSFITISSDPLPLPKRALSLVSPSPHPDHDEELAFEIQRRYEKRMNKRSECNSPLVVRRLIL